MNKKLKVNLLLEKSVSISECLLEVQKYGALQKFRAECRYQGEGAGTETSVNDEPKTAEWVQVERRGLRSEVLIL